MAHLSRPPPEGSGQFPVAHIHGEQVMQTDDPNIFSMTDKVQTEEALAKARDGITSR